MKGLFFVFLAFTAAASATTIGFVSDNSWAVTNSSNVFIGNAQTVCLNSSAPLTCPGGAVQYGFVGPGWAANLSSIPNAAWIWAPEVNGATNPAELVSYTFTKNFVLNGTPTGGSILIAADDFARVVVNGSQVGTAGSTSNSILAAQQASLTTFDLSSFLLPGQNTIAITAQNGIGAFGHCEVCTYAQNPAGAVFGGSLSFNAAEVPEPSTLILFVAGISLLAIGRNRNLRRR